LKILRRENGEKSTVANSTFKKVKIIIIIIKKKNSKLWIFEGSKPPKPRSSPLRPTPWGYDLFDNYARFPNTKVVATIQNSATQTGKRKYSL
jgi:hypothetical protein